MFLFTATNSDVIIIIPHARAEMLLRRDLIFDEFIHKAAQPIMSYRMHCVLFITLHCVILSWLNLAQSKYDAVTWPNHLANICLELVNAYFRSK